MTASGRKLCIATPEFPPERWGGLARTVEKVARHASDLGFEVHVAYFVVEESPVVLLDENRHTFSQDGIVVHRISLGKEKISGPAGELWDCPHNLTLQMMYQSLEMLHLAEDFDYFQSFFLYPVGYVAGLLARRKGIPSVVCVVGNDVKKYVFSPEKAAVCMSGLENADLVVALSLDLVEMADALAPVKHKASIIYNSVEIPAESQRSGRERDVPVRIGCAAIFKYAKGLPYLFKAVADLAINRSLTLELAGELRDSERDSYVAMLARTGIGDLVRPVGRIPHHRMPDWLSTLDLFVLPSLTEGCPNVLMEALACGVPCVATRTGAVGDLVEHGVSGLLVPWGDSRSLASAMSSVIDDLELARMLGAAARLKMKEFSWEREREAWAGVYRKLRELKSNCDQ